MTRILPTSARAIAGAMAAIVAFSTGGAAQQTAKPAAADGNSVEGWYSISFTPANGEALVGRMEIRQKEGREIAIFTSPRLNGPLVADSLSIANGRVYASIFRGGYTFEFHLNGDAISDAKYTKTVQDKTERGPADIRRATP